MLVSKQLTVTIDFHSMEKILWKSMATVNQHSSKNIFFCVQQKKIGLEQVEGE